MNAPLRVGSLFSGYAGLDMALEAVTDTGLAWVCDNDPTAAQILRHHHPHVPNLGDITEVDWNSAEPVDAITAGFPCQDISDAGQRAGITKGRNSGLWRHIIRAASALRPRLIILENVAAITRRGLDTVAGDLASIGYDARWCTLRASDIGAPHQRNRWFAIAYPTATTDPARIGMGEQADATHPITGSGNARPEPRRRSQHPADPDSLGRERCRDSWGWGCGPAYHHRGPVEWWGRYADAINRWEGVTRRYAPPPTNDRGRLSPAFVEWMMGLPEGHVTGVPGVSPWAMLRCLGNGVVPQQAATAIRQLLAPLRKE